MHNIVEIPRGIRPARRRKPSSPRGDKEILPGCTSFGEEENWKIPWCIFVAEILTKVGREKSRRFPEEDGFPREMQRLRERRSSREKRFFEGEQENCSFPREWHFHVHYYCFRVWREPTQRSHFWIQCNFADKDRVDFKVRFFREVRRGDVLEKKVFPG